jgi:hypothetical protein
MRLMIVDFEFQALEYSRNSSPTPAGRSWSMAASLCLAIRHQGGKEFCRIGFGIIGLEPAGEAPARLPPSSAPRPPVSPARLGRIGLRLGGAKAQRWATTSVLAVASGRSSNSSAIIGGFDPGLAARTRTIGGIDVGGIGDAQHRIVRREKPGSAKCAGFVATSGRSRA